MITVKKTRFYLGMSLVARAISIAAFIMGTIVGLIGIGVFFFAHSFFSPIFVIGPALIILGGWIERGLANMLVKQYGMSA